MLKEIFKRIEKFQTKLEFEFTGLVWRMQPALFANGFPYKPNDCKNWKS
jgi:hypothetical protein